MASTGVSSGTYAWAPPIGDLIVAAYRRVKVHRSEIVTEHFADAKTELNLLQVSWANLGPLLWTVDLQTISIIAGQPTYSVPANTVMMLDVYTSIPNGDGTTSDTLITPLSRTEYASMPNKSQQGGVTSFWFDRTIAPTVTFWQTPNGQAPTISYYRFTQIQDAVVTNAGAAQIPYLALDAYVAGLAHRLARIYAPDLESVREADATKATNLMFSQLVENVPLYVSPITDAYWR